MSGLLLTPDAFLSRRSATSRSRLFNPSSDASTTAAASTAELRRRHAQVFCEELKAVIEEARADGWDGPGSVAFDMNVLGALNDFINALPNSFPFPTLSIDFQGRLILEWTTAGGAFLACFINRNGRFSYSFLFAGQQTYGSFDFSGDQLPVEFSAVATRWWRAASTAS